MPHTQPEDTIYGYTLFDRKGDHLTGANNKSYTLVIDPRVSDAGSSPHRPRWISVVVAWHWLCPQPRACP